MARNFSNALNSFIWDSIRQQKAACSQPTRVARCLTIDRYNTIKGSKFPLPNDVYGHASTIMVSQHLSKPALTINPANRLVIYQFKRPRLLCKLGNRPEK